MNQYDVIIIGGGITGVGTARDCALRGLKVLLLARGDLTAGATGRNHGLLHSGARYAVTDRDSAAECIRENKILRRIAAHCVEPTGGLFITLPEDDLSYQDNFIKCCIDAGIKAEAIDPKEALKMEPSVNPALIGAVKVPDASVDPFRLATANALDAKLHGAVILTYHEVVSFIKDKNWIVGVQARDTRTGKTEKYYAPLTVNAAGIWGQNIAGMAGCQIKMLPAKGSLLIFGHRVNNMVINRCRKPANADILVPGDVVCVIGTTSDKVPMEECDDIRVTGDEVQLLLKEGCLLSPSLAHTRILRAYAGVRPLVASDDDPTGRKTSRGIVLLDHDRRDGIPGFISITGGKLTSYRLMGEMATDLVCDKLGRRSRCRTAELPLPGSEKELFDSAKGLRIAEKAAIGRQGTMVSKMDFSHKSEILCECEHVTRAEIAYAAKYLDVHNMMDLRRRTRVGMGTCQGSFCMKKVAAALARELGCPERTEEFIREYIEERWKGMAPVCWGESLCEAEYMRKLYADKKE
ncbi:MAG: anaerobic glycerol-3-phosphate dehydrogenase subunit A [Bacteroidales bacterium]|nr:anaerobic glycerol-3-phosphate dehydrogenase subunit A [Bacteroidales bacterium]